MLTAWNACERAIVELAESEQRARADWVDLQAARYAVKAAAAEVEAENETSLGG